MANLLTFEAAGRQFALAAGLVRQVTRAVAVAPLPRAPPIVEGVINVHGTLVPVLALRQRFGLAAVPLHPDQHFIIAQAGPRVVALRVDRVQELVSVEPDAIEPAAGIVPGAEYVAGIAKLPNGLLVIHDLERFLSLEEGGQVDVALGDQTPSGAVARSRRSGQ